MTLGQKIRAARLEQRLTQEQLAARDFTKSYVSELERDHRTPRLTTLKILARRLNRPLSYFLDGATEERESEALLMVGLAHLQAESFPQAAAWLKRAQESAAADGDDVMQARIELGLAWVDQGLGHDLRAWRRAERAIHTLTRVDDRDALIRAHVCVGRSKLAAGDPASAAWTFEAALRLSGEDARPSIASALHYALGIARERMGDAAGAGEAFVRALDIAESFADPKRAAAWHVERGAASAEDGAFDAAVAHAGEAAAVYEALDHKRQLAEVHWRLGDLAARAERWADAQRHYSVSIAVYSAAGLIRGAARTLGYFVDAVRSGVPPETARVIGETALALFPDAGGPEMTTDDDRAGALWLRGTIQRILGRVDASRGSLTESLRLFERLCRAEEAKTVRRELALLAVEANDLAAAREYLSVLWQAPDRSQITVPL